MNTEVLVAEQSNSQQALRESEQRYKRLLGATTDYIYTVDLHDRAGGTSHGPGCESVTGYGPEDFAGDPYLWYRVIHPEDRSAVLAQVERILKDKNPPPLEHRIIHKDGRVRWIRNTTIPHRDGQGRLVAYDGLISDITGRKEAELALRESQERLELVIHGSSDGIWDWNVVTGETYFSPRWKSMLGYGDDELANNFSTWENLLHPDDRELALGKLKAYFAGETKTYELEHRLRHKDGSYRWMLARGVALRDGHGKPLRMAGSHVDLTERKQAAERLQQANVKLASRSEALKKILHQLRASHRELKATQLQLIQAAKMESVGTLAAGVAHEVKNPLQTIIMGLHVVAQQLPPGDPDLALTVQDMRDAVKRASSIIGELLKFSAAMDFQPQPQDLHPVIEQSLRLVRNDLASGRIHLQRRFAPNLPWVQIDPGRIQQVFLNLFLNAIQAMPQGGTLFVVTSTVRVDEEQIRRVPLLRGFRLGDLVVLAEVQDTGSGIQETVLPRVFDPFFTTKPVGVGTGLGLSIAKKIIDLHRGSIEIKNTSPPGVVVTIALSATPEPKT